jgi:hypothetical protein
METEGLIIEAFALETQRGVERRRSRRFLCSGQAEGLFHRPDVLFRGEVRDMSLTGCLIQTRAQLRVQPQTEVELRFQVNNNHYRTLARVVEIRSGQGVGMEFMHEDTQTLASFKGLMITLQRMMPKPQEAKPAETKNSESLPE